MWRNDRIYTNSILSFSSSDSHQWLWKRPRMQVVDLWSILVQQVVEAIILWLVEVNGFVRIEKELWIMGAMKSKIGAMYRITLKYNIYATPCEELWLKRVKTQLLLSEAQPNCSTTRTQSPFVCFRCLTRSNLYITLTLLSCTHFLLYRVNNQS